MIILEMEGGLGNQMFQYAFAKACSVRSREQLFLDLTWYRNKSSKRRFLLDKLNVSYGRSSANRLSIGMIKLVKNPSVLKDEGFFEEKSLEIHGNTLLEGYWESYKYFEAIAEDIKKGFALKKPSEIFIELSKDIRPDSIAIHVRRGDFLALTDSRCQNGVPYYTRAVEQIVEKRGLRDPQIVVFSDDPEWCKAELRSLAGRPTAIFEGKLDSDAEELMLMSLYGNQVISNSTFSWWAAYLNPNPDKTIVMPKDWFMDTDRNSKHLSGMKVPGWIVV